MSIKSISVVEKRREAIRRCIAKYSLPENPAIDDELFEFEGTPDTVSVKLACLILSYKREATTAELKMVSDQPPATIRDLRVKHGFIFKRDSKKPSDTTYRNSKGEKCRQIIGFKSPKAQLRSKLKVIVDKSAAACISVMIDKSVAACISAIEIYNKPNFKYREESFSILLVNAWELLLKAKLASDSTQGIRDIQVIEKGAIKENRSGNPMTIDIRKVVEKLLHTKNLDQRCKVNIELLIEIRDNAIHFINKENGFKSKVQEIGMASLKNYLYSAKAWFDLDLSEYNFYLMPMSFFYPTEIESILISPHDKQIENLLEYLQRVEAKYPYDDNNPYSVTLKVKTEVVKSDTGQVGSGYKITTDKSDPTAKTILIKEEDKLKGRLTYDKLIEELKKRYTDFKINQSFYKIKRDFENQEKYGDRYCLVRYHNPRTKRGPMRFYHIQLIPQFDAFYNKK